MSPSEGAEAAGECVEAVVGEYLDSEGEGGGGGGGGGGDRVCVASERIGIDWIGERRVMVGVKEEDAEGEDEEKEEKVSLWRSDHFVISD